MLMVFRIANDRRVDICKGPLARYSDGGVRHSSKECVWMLRSARKAISMTGCGDTKENTIAERINPTLKNEILDKRGFENIECLEGSLAEAISFYNNFHPHLRRM